MFAEDAASDPPVGSRSRGAKQRCRPPARCVQDLGGGTRTQLQPKLAKEKTIAQQFCFTTCFYHKGIFNFLKDFHMYSVQLN